MTARSQRGTAFETVKMVPAPTLPWRLPNSPAGADDMVISICPEIVIIDLNAYIFQDGAQFFLGREKGFRQTEVIFQNLVQSLTNLFHPITKLRL